MQVLIIDDNVAEIHYISIFFVLLFGLQFTTPGTNLDSPWMFLEDEINIDLFYTMELKQYSSSREWVFTASSRVTPMISASYWHWQRNSLIAKCNRDIEHTSIIVRKCWTENVVN